MPSKLEFGQFLKDKGASKEQFVKAYNMFEEQGGVWDDEPQKIDTPYKEILSTPKQISDASDEGHAQAILGTYYQKRDGSEMSPEMTTARVKAEFGHESFMSAMSQLQQTYNMEPQGPEKKHLRTKADYVANPLKVAAKTFPALAKSVVGSVGLSIEQLVSGGQKDLKGFEGRAVERVQRRTKAVTDFIDSITPESWTEAEEAVAQELSEQDVGFLRTGFLMLSQNAGNLAVSATTPPPVAFASMFSTERQSMADELSALNINSETVEAMSSLYGMTSAPIEYIENVGRLSGAAGKKGASVLTKPVRRAVAGMLKNAGANVTEELTQEGLHDLIYNLAITEHNKATGENLPMKEVLGEAGDVAKGSLAMSTVLDAMGLPSRRMRYKSAKRQQLAEMRSDIMENGGNDVLTEPLTAGEAKQYGEMLTDEEVDELYEPSEQRENFKGAIRGYLGALQAFNQNNVGVEEQLPTFEIKEDSAGKATEEATVAEAKEDLAVLEDLEGAMQADKRTEEVAVDGEVVADAKVLSPQFEERGEVEINAPELTDDVEAWEQDQILYAAKLITTGAITTKTEYNDFISSIETPDQADADMLWNEAKKVVATSKARVKAAERKSAKAKVTQKSFKPNKEMILVDAAVELKRMYRQTIKDIESGKKLGKKQQIEKQKQLELKHNLLTRRALALIDIYAETTKEKNQFKAQLLKSDGTPRVLGEKSLQRFFNGLHSTIEKQRHTDAKTELKHVIKQAKNVQAWVPRLRERVESAITGVAVSDLSEKKRETLEARKDVAEREDHLIPSKAIEELDRLEAEAVSGMSAEEVSELAETLRKVVELNNKMIAARTNIKDLNLQNKKNGLNRFLDTRKDMPVLMKKILDNKLVNHLRKAEHIIEEIDGTPLGRMAQTVLEPMRSARNKENTSGRPLMEELHKIATRLPDGWFMNRRTEEVAVDGRTLTVGEVMGVYAHSKNNDNRKYLRRNNKFRNQAQIDAFIGKLTSAEKVVVDEMMALMDTQYEDMAQVSYNMTGQWPNQLEDYMPLSFVQEQGNAKFNEDNDLLRDGQVKNPYVEKGFTHERKGSDRELDLNFVDVVERHIMDVNRYTAYAETVKDTQNILNDKNIRSSVERVGGEAVVRELDDWLLRSANPNRRFEGMPQGVENLARTLRMRMTVANLGLNAISSLTQLSSMPLTMRRIGFGSAVEGVGTLLSDYKAKIDGVHEKSAMMQMRSKSFDRDYKDFMQNRSAKAMFEGNDKLMSAYFSTLRSVDQFTAYSSWLGAYQKKLSESNDEGAATRYADDVIEKTQPMGDVMNLASIQAGPEVMKLFTPFYTAMSHVYNEIDTTTRGALRKDISFDKWLGGMFWMVVIPALWNHLIRNPEKEDLLDPKKVAVSHMNYLSGTIPVFGGAASSLFNEYPYTPVPALEGVKYVSRIKGAIAKDDWGRALENVAIGSGYVFPWPSKQAVRTISGLSDLITGETDDIRRLIYSDYSLGGKDKKESASKKKAKGIAGRL